MLAKPAYIDRARVGDLTLRYEWHDWVGSKYCEPVDEALVRRYASLAPEAMIAMTIAEAEWLMFRFERLSDDPVPFQYLESAWCANVDRKYSWPIELRRSEWRGPVRRPMWLGVVFTNHLLYEMEQLAEGIKQPAQMSRLVEHVLTEPEPFREWRDHVLGRLVELYGVRQQNPFERLFDDAPDLPRLVPRQVFDPAFPFHPGMTAELVDQFLMSVDYTANPFLLSPAQMREEGFAGMPYRVSI